MGGLFVCVYAICKNEAQFADRWMDSMSEADRVIVLDTGSTDDTADRLRQRGAEVTVEEVMPWRFDTARNRALALVPENADICVCTDLDEVFRPGWRDRLEAAWKPGTRQARYRYVWSFEGDGREGVVFFGEKIHARKGWHWTHPVHEVLQCDGAGASAAAVTVEGMQLEHHPDPTKSRGQYLGLLELSVREQPDDDRNVHYLGREYLYYRRWDDCIAMLQRHLALPAARWLDERAASMRYIAKAYLGKGERSAARDWYLRAVTEAPYLREAYVDLALLLYSEEDWDGVLYFTGCALRILERPQSYICEAAAWGALPWDLRAIALYHTGRIGQSLVAARQALELSPEDLRLQQNVACLAKLAESSPLPQPV